MKQKGRVEYISVEYCADIYSYNISGTVVPYSCTTVKSYVSKACKIVTNWKLGSPHTTSFRQFLCRRPRLCSWSAATGAFCWWSRFRWVLATTIHLRNIFAWNTLSNDFDKVYNRTSLIHVQNIYIQITFQKECLLKIGRQLVVVRLTALFLTFFSANSRRAETSCPWKKENVFWINLDQTTGK